MDFWCIERIAGAGRLHNLFGKVRFGLDGYNDDPRELFEIPEARAFLRKLTEEWPYFFYASDLEDRFLDTLIKCLVPNLKVIRAPNMPTDWRVSVKVAEVNAVCERLRTGLIQACSLDKDMDEPLYDGRETAIRAYVNKGLVR